MKLVVDHVRGSRRGQRQVLPCGARVTIGRHPASDISFDAHRDLDASSRHAEIRRDGDRYVLCDVGSSNGTLVDGERIDELELPVGEAVVAEFGVGGPTLRLWIGGDDEVPDVQPVTARRPRRVVRALGIAAAVAAAVAALAWWLS